MQTNSCFVKKKRNFGDQEKSQLFPRTTSCHVLGITLFAKTSTKDMKLVGTCWKMSNKGSKEKDK